MSGVPVRPLTPMPYWPKLWSCTRGPVEQSERSATKPVAPTIAVELLACISFCTSKTYRWSVVMLLEKNFEWHLVVVTVALHPQTENHPKRKNLCEFWSYFQSCGLCALLAFAMRCKAVATFTASRISK